jgi:hypothetical protein
MGEYGLPIGYAEFIEILSGSDTELPWSGVPYTREILYVVYYELYSYG